MMTPQKICLLAIICTMTICMMHGADQIETPPEIQRNLNEQRRYGLAGLLGFTVDGAIGRTPTTLSKESRDEIKRRVVDRVIRELRSNELKALTDNDFDSELDRAGPRRSSIVAQTGVIWCSIDWIKTGEAGMVRTIVFDVSAWMTNPRTGKTGIISVWTHTESRVVKDTSTAEVFVFSDAVQKFVIDYLQAQR